MARRRWASAALAVLLVTALSAPAWGYVPSLADIYRSVAQRQPAVQRVMLETRTYVFDPLGRDGTGAPSTNPDATPPEVPSRSYRQKIYWIRNAFLGIETYAEDGTLLHFYLDEGLHPVEGNLTPGRTFSEADVVPPFLPFLAVDPARWQQAVHFWGINPQRVAIDRGPKGEELYRLEGGDGNALWLEPGLLRPVKLQTHLAGGDGNGHVLTIEFSEFLFVGDSPNDQDNFYFPRTVNFLLDGRLFKQTVVLNFATDPSVQGFPITKLRQLAAKVQSPAPVSFVSPPQAERPLTVPTTVPHSVPPTMPPHTAAEGRP